MRKPSEKEKQWLDKFQATLFEKPKTIRLHSANGDRIQAYTGNVLDKFQLIDYRIIPVMDSDGDALNEEEKYEKLK
jgi:hypothetical protein